MSFTFGQFSFADSLPTSFAIQREFPNMSGLGIESLEVPGMERRRFLQTDRPATSITFDVILHSDTEAGLELIRDQFVTFVDPALGPQRLVLDDFPDWYWMATVSDEIVWEKLTWGCEYRGYRYRANVVFETYGDAASRLVTENKGVSVHGETTVQLDGNTRAWPRWEFSSPLGKGSTVRFTISPVLGKPSHVVEVQGPLSAGQKMVLDYDTMQFAVWQGSKKVASLVDRMSTLERPEIHPILGEVSVQAGVVANVTYKWAGTPHASESIKYADGVEVARNYVTNPSLEKTVDPWIMLSSSYGSLSLQSWKQMQTGSRMMVATASGESKWMQFSDGTRGSTTIPKRASWAGGRFFVATGLGAGAGVRFRVFFYGETGSSLDSVWPEGESFQDYPRYDGKVIKWVAPVPEGAAQVQILFQAYSYSSDAGNVSGRVWTDAIMVTVADSEAEALAHVQNYFDGDSPTEPRGSTPVPATFYTNDRRQ